MGLTFVNALFAQILPAIPDPWAKIYTSLVLVEVAIAPLAWLLEPESPPRFCFQMLSMGNDWLFSGRPLGRSPLEESWIYSFLTENCISVFLCNGRPNGFYWSSLCCVLAVLANTWRMCSSGDFECCGHCELGTLGRFSGVLGEPR